MINSNFIITDANQVKKFIKKENGTDTKANDEIRKEKERLNKLEIYIILLPVLVMLTGIIIMHVLYKIFMN